MEIELSGQKGERQIEQDWTGRETTADWPGKRASCRTNMHLTLDLDLQKQAYDILGQVMEANRNTVRVDEITGERTFPEIEQAAVVAMNPQTGEILAMVNYPTFDNNRFGTEVPVDYYLGLARNDYTPLGQSCYQRHVSRLARRSNWFQQQAPCKKGLCRLQVALRAPGAIEIKNRFAPNDPGRAQTVCLLGLSGGEHGFMDMWQRNG